MTTYEHTVKLRQKKDKQDAQKGNTSSRTQVEILSPRNQLDNGQQSPNAFKLHEQTKLPKIESTGNVHIRTDQINDDNSKFNYINANYDYELDKTNQISSIEFQNEPIKHNHSQENNYRMKRLFHHRSSHQNGLPCSNSETNNNYYIVNDENETSRESFSLNNLKDSSKETFERRSTSNIVKLPPLLPVTNTRTKRSKQNNMDGQT